VVATRRSILRGAAGAAFAAPLAGGFVYLAGSADAADGGPVPATLHRRRSGPVTGTLRPEADFPLTHLGLTLTGAGTAAVRVRTAAGFGPWREAIGCAAGSDTKARRSAVVAVRGAQSVEIQATGGAAPTVVELNTVDGPTRATAPRPSTLPVDGAAGKLQRPVYVNRAGWGADEAFRLNPDGTLDTPPTFFPVQTLTVHHTGFDDDQPDPAATIRAIYYNQAVELDWGDVGYQLFIDDAGRVYEGVFSDDDAIPVFGPDLGADGRPQMVNGSHVGGFNAGNVGVVLIGDFTARQPSAAARRSLTAVLAILSAGCRLDPTGTTDYVNPVNGNLATLPTIAGHRQWNTANPAAGATECPGNTFFPELPGIRTQVADLLRSVGIGDG